jgi:uncharacterized membrane protein YecN with MAPEG domain
MVGLLFARLSRLLTQTIGLQVVKERLQTMIAIIRLGVMRLQAQEPWDYPLPRKLSRNIGIRPQQ